MTSPDYGTTALDGLPAAVTICEVGPRDGLQNESMVLTVEVKAEFVRRLVDAGHTVVETTSFVHPHRSVAESLDAVGAVTARARAAGLGIRGYVSMCFGDPWEGQVPVSQVVDVAVRLVESGCSELSIGDTIGVATPGQVVALIDALVGAAIPIGDIAVHFHDTYGQALANTLAALRRGVTTVDSSAGGLGGCPYAGSATGNLATEDLLWQLHGLGIETGVDLQKMVETSVWMAEQLGRPSPSRPVTALSA